MPKNWCFWTVVLEKTLESPLDCRAIQPVHPKGNQSWIFIGRTDVEAETPSWLIWKDPDAEKDWVQEAKGMTEDEMVGWHHLLDGHELEHAPGVGDGQGSLLCWSPWGCKESETTEWLNWKSFLRIQSKRKILDLFWISSLHGSVAILSNLTNMHTQNPLITFPFVCFPNQSAFFLKIQVKA